MIVFCVEVAIIEKEYWGSAKDGCSSVCLEGSFLKKASIRRFFLLNFFYAVLCNLAHPITPTFLNELQMPSYMFGVAFACMAGVRLIQAWRYHHDPTYARRVEAVNTDERIAFVANKAADLTFRTSVLVLFALSVVMRVLDHGVVADTLALTAALQTLAYWVTYMIMSQKY